MSDLTGPRFEPQTSRVRARPTGWWNIVSHEIIFFSFRINIVVFKNFSNDIIKAFMFFQFNSVELAFSFFKKDILQYK